MPDRFVAIGSRLLLAIAALALALMMAVLCWQVFARYVLGSSPAWAEQSALLLMIWMTFLGSASGIADGFHIRIVEGLDTLPGRWRSKAAQLANAMIIVAGLAIGWFGAELVEATWCNAVPTLPLTRGMAYLVIPLSGVLMAMAALHHLLQGQETGGSVGSA